jgi:hypothetical protein
MNTHPSDEPFEDPPTPRIALATDEPFDDAAPDGSDPQVAPATEQAIARQSTDLVTRAVHLTITDPDSFNAAGEVLDILKTKRRQVWEFFEADCARAHATWVGLTAKRAQYVKPLDAAIDVVSGRYAAFAKEEKRKAEEDRRAREEAARQAEEQRLRVEADAKAAEATALAAAAVAAPTRDEGAVLEAQADQARAEAEQLAIESRTVQAPVLPLQPSVTPPKHVSVGEKWEYELTSKRDLIKAVAAGTVSEEALIENRVYLTKRATADKLTVKIPGVRFFDAGKVTHRQRK